MTREMRLVAYLVYAEINQDPIQSKDISDWMDLQPSQVRRDLGRINCRGRQGVGYKGEDIRRAVLAHINPHTVSVAIEKQREVINTITWWLVSPQAWLNNPSQ